jgi:AAHS family 4-hydroxybenzoate transporter-like MFS transporter
MAEQQRQVDVAEFVSSRGMGGYQILIFLLCLTVVVFDGYDTQAIGYVAPYMLKELNLTRAQLGPIFSAALIGSGVGALLAGPIADRVGRKPVIIAAALTFGVFTYFTALSTGVTELLVYRFLAGLGLGGALANASALVVEYTPRRRQVTAVLWLFLGFSLGSMIGGFLSSIIIGFIGWRSIFYIGALVPVLMAPVLWIWLPESIRFLTLKQGNNDAAGAILKRVDPSYQPEEGAVYVINETRGKDFPVKQLFQEGRSLGTLLMWTVSFMSLFAIFFLQNWLPTIAADAGMKIEQAVLATTMIQVGSIVCSFVIGWPMSRFGQAPVLGVMYFIGWLAISAIGFTLTEGSVLMLVCFVVGCCIAAGQNGINALTSTFYPTVMRVTGVGWTQGIGRLGAILSPFLGSAMIAWKYPHAPMFLVVGVPSLLASIAFAVLAMKYEAARAPTGVKPPVGG